MQTADGVVTLTLDNGDTVSTEVLLLTTGRIPNSDRLNVAATGVTTHADGRVVVNDMQETVVPGIFALMDPMPGAVESFTELAALFDAYVLSTAPWENPSAWSDKLLWVKRHLGAPAYKRLILSHHKNLNAGDFLVDDRTKNGADRFAGEHLLFGSGAFPDWAAVTGYLRGRQ